MHRLAANSKRTLPPFPGPLQGQGAQDVALCGSAFQNNAEFQGSYFLPVGKPALLLLRKKTHCDVKLCFLALSFTNGGVEDSETYGLRFPGKTLANSRELGKRHWGRVVPAHQEPSALPRGTQRHHPPSSCLRVLESAHPKAPDTAQSEKDSLAEVIHVAKRYLTSTLILKGWPPKASAFSDLQTFYVHIRSIPPITLSLLA